MSADVTCDTCIGAICKSGLIFVNYKSTNKKFYVKKINFRAIVFTARLNTVCPPATATSSNQEPNGELVTVHSLSPHLLRGIAYRQN